MNGGWRVGYCGRWRGDIDREVKEYDNRERRDEDAPTPVSEGDIRDGVDGLVRPYTHLRPDSVLKKKKDFIPE